MRAPALICLGLTFFFLAQSTADEPVKFAPEDIAFFEKTIRPLLADRCYSCHGEEEQESELRLDTYEGLMKGGVSGDTLVEGKPDESLLVIAVSYKNEDLQMPPDAKLTDEEINHLREWVLKGVPHPDASKAPRKKPGKDFPDERRSHWSFQPPVQPAVPAVKNATWARTPIDHFVLSLLEARGLAPQGPAEKRALIRRATFDLLGLPPTPEEIDAFLRDDSPEAYARLIDRLLSSPHYGERWGRHWLDVSRYADSNGLDENVAHGHAWRYRDYVVDSFNRDKPFAQFVREQIAGDLLPAADEPSRHEQLIATGFLSLGPKVLAEVDELKMEMDIVDEQIDTVGRSLLSLTLGCARCHDHKFDPIRTEDYYALAGVFRSTKTMETFKKVAKWNELVIATPEELAAKAAHEKQIAEQKETIQKLVDEANAALRIAAGPEAQLPKNPESQYPAETKAELKKLRDQLAKLEKNPPPLSMAMGVSESKVLDTEVCIRGSHLTLGKVVPRGIPAIFARNDVDFPTSSSGRLELANWLVDAKNPLTARVIVNRVWRWHFGRGLVESVDNFGLLGDQPTNQPLLDWLAIWFVNDGWSMKRLHRLIMTSAVYQQQSYASVNRTGEKEKAASSADPAIVDPENRLLWHFPVRRLEAEAIRDALLAVSDRLDRTQGGSLLHVKNREYFFDHTSKDTTNYDTRRRSVYLPVVRNNLYDVFQLFDSTDATVPSGDRASSTVATQALFVLNSPLMIESAEALAGTIVAHSADPRKRIDLLFERCFGRPASDQDFDQAMAFLEKFSTTSNRQESQGESQEAWVALCHSLLATNEFIYVR